MIHKLKKRKLSLIVWVLKEKLWFGCDHINWYNLSSYFRNADSIQEQSNARNQVDPKASCKSRQTYKILLRNIMRIFILQNKLLS